jgi:hypothetical protein
MKKDILFANGCSFTAGGGLDPWYMEYNNQPLGDILGTYDVSDGYYDRLHKWEEENEPEPSYDNNEKRLRMLWPYKLSKLMDMSEHVNLSMGCGSNQRIVRTTLEWIMEQDRSRLDRTIAIIQLTEPSRYEYYQDDIDNWTLNKIHHIQLIGTDAEVELAKVLNQQRLSTFTSVEGILKIVDICLTLDNIFKSFGIEYYLCTNSNYMRELTRLIKIHQPKKCNYESHRYSGSSLKKYLSLINRSCNWICGTYEKSVLCEMGLETLHNDAHYSEQGHTQLASLLHSQFR